MAGSIPETVTVPGELMLQALARIQSFAERELILNGRSETGSTLEIQQWTRELFDAAFGLGSGWDSDADRPSALWDALERRSKAFACDWTDDLVGNADREPVA